MKRLLFVLLSSFPVVLFSQHALEPEFNLPRSGDILLKQQVQYKDPGRPGENVIWNFGQLESIQDSYSLVYAEPYGTGDSMYILGMDTLYARDLDGAQLLIGTEHYTQYYYLFRDGCLWNLGHENAATLLHYPQPLLAGKFPLAYGEKQCAPYQTKGLYSRSIPFETAGSSCVEADAYGMMVLPSGDTLRQVIRTKTTQVFSEHLPSLTGEWVELTTHQDNYKWYSKGYRYPVFETIQTLICRDSTEINRFETAFFFPPQEHYYLEEDAANLSMHENGDDDTPVDPWSGLSYNLYPNPVQTTLHVELYLPQPATVHVQLRSTMGLIVLDRHQGSYPAGVCSFQIHTASLPVGNYVLDIGLNEKMISGIVMKR